MASIQSQAYRTVIADLEHELPRWRIAQRRKVRNFAQFATDAECEEKGIEIEKILAANGEPLPQFGDGSLIPVLEKLIQLVLKYLPAILALF